MSNVGGRSWSDFWKQNRGDEESRRDFNFVMSLMTALIASSFLILLATGDKAGFHQDNTVLANTSVVVGLASTLILAMYSSTRFAATLLRALHSYVEHRNSLREAEIDLPKLRRERARLMDELTLALRKTPDVPQNLPMILPGNVGMLSEQLEKGKFPTPLGHIIQDYINICQHVDQLEDRLCIPRSSLKRTVTYAAPIHEEDAVFMRYDETPAPAEDIRAAAL